MNQLRVTFPPIIQRLRKINRSHKWFFSSFLRIFSFCAHSYHSRLLLTSFIISKMIHKFKYLQILYSLLIPHLYLWITVKNQSFFSAYFHFKTQNDPSFHISFKFSYTLTILYLHQCLVFKKQLLFVPIFYHTPSINSSVHISSSLYTHFSFFTSINDSHQWTTHLLQPFLISQPKNDSSVHISLSVYTHTS